MEQQIQFCKTSEGVHLAYATIGQGPPLVWPAYWVGHLEEEWTNPRMQSFFRRLALHHTIVKYDKHGCGLSDRDRSDFSPGKEVRDLEAVIDHLGLKQFALFGMSQGGPTAISYASKKGPCMRCSSWQRAGSIDPQRPFHPSRGGGSHTLVRGC